MQAYMNFLVEVDMAVFGFIIGLLLCTVASIWLGFIMYACLILGSGKRAFVVLFALCGLAWYLLLSNSPFTVTVTN